MKTVKYKKYLIEINQTDGNRYEWTIRRADGSVFEQSKENELEVTFKAAEQTAKSIIDEWLNF